MTPPAGCRTSDPLALTDVHVCWSGDFLPAVVVGLGVVVVVCGGVVGGLSNSAVIITKAPVICSTQKAMLIRFIDIGRV